MKSLIVACTMGMLLLSCSKSKVDNEGPVITVTSPANHQSFGAGQTVTIAGVITDEDELHEVHLEVKNKASNAEVIHLEEHPDKKPFTLSSSFTAQAGVSYHIQVEANDHSGNETKVEIEVSGR